MSLRQESAPQNVQVNLPGQWVGSQDAAAGNAGDVWNERRALPSLLGAAFPDSTSRYPGDGANASSVLKSLAPVGPEQQQRPALPLPLATSMNMPLNALSTSFVPVSHGLAASLAHIRPLRSEGFLQPEQAQQLLLLQQRLPSTRQHALSPHSLLLQTCRRISTPRSL